MSKKNFYHDFFFALLISLLDIEHGESKMMPCVLSLVKYTVSFALIFCQVLDSFLDPFGLFRLEFPVLVETRPDVERPGRILVPSPGM
jgi:hypothetical protein